MLVEEIARLTGTLKFNVDARPLITFEKRLNSVMQQLEAFSKIANKKFNIKVALDSKTLRAQLDKAASAKVVIKNFDVDAVGITELSNKITTKLGNAPVRLSNIRIDIGSLIEQKRLVRTLVEQVKVDLPVKLQFTAANKMLRDWKKSIEEAFKVKLDAFVMQSPKIKMSIDKEHLHKEIRDALAQIRAETRIKVQLDARGPTGGGGGGGGVGRKSVAAGAFGAAAGSKLGSASMGFGRGLLPGLGAAFAVRSLSNINNQLVGSEIALEAVSGNSEEFASNLDFLNGLAKEQGRTMRDITPQFTSVLAAAKDSIGSEGVQDLFRGITKFGTVMHLDKEAMKGSLKAIGQMFSKDQVMAEEARGQFAERMPGGMKILAEAAGMSVKEFGEAMEKGLVDPKKVIPEMGRIMERFAESNGRYAKSLASTIVQQGKFDFQFEKSVKLFAKAGMDKGLASFWGAASKSLENAEPLVKALGQAFEMVMRPINAFMLTLGEIGRQWPKIAEAFGLTEGQLAALAVTAGLLLLPFGGLLLAIAGISLAIEDLIGYSKGMDSVFGNWLKDTPGAQQALDNLGKAIDTLVHSLSATGGKLDGIITKVGVLSNALSGLSFSQTFVSTMDKLASLLSALAHGIEAVGGVVSGDTGKISSGLTGMKSGIQDYMKQTLFDLASTLLKAQAENMISERSEEKAFQKFGAAPLVFPMQPPPGPITTTPGKSSVEQQTAPLGPVSIEIKVMPGMDNPKHIATEVDKRLRETFQMWHTKEVK